MELLVSELKGMAQKDLAKLKKVPGKPGYVFVPLKKQFIGHITKKLTIEATRKKFNLAEGKVNGNNIPILEKLIHLREQKASLLGFNSFAEMRLKDKMAKTPQNVEKFLDDLIKKISAYKATKIRTNLLS